MYTKKNIHNDNSVGYSRVVEKVRAVRIPNVIVKCENCYIVFSSEEILYATRDGQSVSIYCKDKKKYTISSSVESVFSKLMSLRNFKRISDSLILNESHISKLSSNKSVLLDNGEELFFQKKYLSSILSG